MPPAARPALVVLVLAALLIGAQAASADTYCVSRPGVCPAADHNFTTIQPAVDAAAANDGMTPGQATRDTVLIGNGSFTGAVKADFDNPVDIIGSGRFDPSAPPASRGTLIRAPDGNNVTTVITSPSFGIIGSGTLHDVSVRVSTGTGNTGIRPSGDVTNVAVFADAPVTNGKGVDFNGNGLTPLRGSSVVLDGPGSLGVNADLALVERTTIEAPTGVRGRGGVVHSSRISANVGVAGSAMVEDSVMRLSGAGATAFQTIGIGVNARDRIQAANVTAIGDGSPGSVAATAHAEVSGGGNSATVEIHSSIIRGFAKNFERSGDGTGMNTAPADITVSYSDYDSTLPKTDTGAGTLNETNPGGNTSAAPGFVSPTNLRLALSSPLVDKGDPNAPNTEDFPEESTLDFDLRPRKIDGDADGNARVDIGAFEVQQDPPVITAATATPRKPITRQLVRFRGAASDPEGEPVTFAWTFGKRKAPAGRSATHRYPLGGRKVAKLTVTDRRGASRKRRVIVRVRGPSIRIRRPRNGAVYRRGQKVRARYRCFEAIGRAKIVRCKGTKRSGRRINTKRLGRHTFRVRARDKAGRRAARVVHYRVVRLKGR